MIDAPPAALEAITVTAPRLEPRAVPAVIGLDDADIRERAPKLLAELFRTLPGVSVRVNSRGESVLRIRGSEERQAAVFLDGAPLAVPWDGRVDLGMLPPGLVSTVDVIKGPAPVEYGANAVAGVFDLHSARAAADGTSASAAGEAGTLGYRSLSALLTHGAGDGGFTLAAGHVQRDAEPLADEDSTPFSQSDDDGRTNTDLESTSLFASAGTVLGAATLRASLLHVDAERGIAPESHLDPALDAPRYWRYPDWELTQLTAAAEAPLGPTRLRVVAWQQWFGQTIDSYRSDSYASLRSREVDDDDTLGARATLGWHSDAVGWRLSATTQTTTHDQVDTTYSIGGVPTAGPKLRFRQRIESLGGEVDWRATDTVTTTLGVARDSASTPLTGDKPPQPDDDAWAWSAVAHFEPGGAWTFTASTGERTRFASPRELFGEALGRFLPNPDLQPETAWLSEVAAEYRSERLAVSVTPFYTRGRDTLAQRLVTVGNATLRQRYNLEGTTSYGVDLLGSWQWTPGLELEIAGSWLEAYSDTPNGLPGRQLPQRPDYELGTALSWRNDRGALARISLRHTGPAVDVAPRTGWVELPSGTELNLRAEWPLHAFGIGTLWLTAAADNLTDAVVYTQAGLPLAGRTLRLGLRLE